MFVRAVPGHAVPRYGTGTWIGAERRTLSAEQKASGESPFVWSSRIVPLPTDYVRRHVRALGMHLRNGELVQCTAAEWKAQCAADEAQAQAEAQAADEHNAADPAEEATS